MNYGLRIGFETTEIGLIELFRFVWHPFSYFFALGFSTGAAWLKKKSLDFPSFLLLISI